MLTFKALFENHAAMAHEVLTHHGAEYRAHDPQSGHHMYRMSAPSFEKARSDLLNMGWGNFGRAGLSAPTGQGGNGAMVSRSKDGFSHVYVNLWGRMS